MVSNDLQVAFVGSGGDGMQVAGEVLIFAAASRGVRGVNVKLFGPAVKGGTSVSITRIGDGGVANIRGECDVVALFSLEAFDAFSEQIGVSPRTLFLVDSREGERARERFPNMETLILPMRDEAKRESGKTLGANMLAVSGLRRLLNLFPDHMNVGVEWAFRGKRRAVANAAMAMYQHGLDWLDARNVERIGEFEFESGSPLAVLNGNESAVLGALSAGCDFYTGYPITPATYSMQLFSSLLWRRGGRFIQAEDEIAAVTMGVGASFAGAKCVTATSGPGLSLMQEGLGLAHMAETPLVVLNVQRGGPSTGLPTLTEQSDLLSALHGSHGDAPRVVLSARNITDCYHRTRKAFQLAEAYQMPVIVLTDAYLATRLETVDSTLLNSTDHPPAERLLYDGDPSTFKRYALTESGVSPTSTPGPGGVPHQISGLEHDEWGRPAMDAASHRVMSEKRYRKIMALHKEWFHMDFHGDEDAKLCVVCHGSSWDVLREAVDRIRSDGQRLALTAPEIMYSLPGTELGKTLERYDHLIVVELSSSAQFFRYLSSNFVLPERVELYNRAGGAPFFADEVEREIRNRLGDD